MVSTRNGAGLVRIANRFQSALARGSDSLVRTADAGAGSAAARAGGIAFRRRGSVDGRSVRSFASIGSGADVAGSDLLIQDLVEQLFGLATADTTLSGKTGRFRHLSKGSNLAGPDESAHGAVGHGVTTANVHRDLLSVMSYRSKSGMVGCKKRLWRLRRSASTAVQADAHRRLAPTRFFCFSGSREPSRVKPRRMAPAVSTSQEARAPAQLGFGSETESAGSDD